MKRLLSAVVLSCAGMLHAASIQTNEVEFAMLKVAPEKFRSKVITYTEVYRNFLTTLPEYIEASGFKAERWLMLEIGDPRLPVMIKKRNDISVLVAGLKAGATVKVTGRVREFKTDSRFALAPKFYLEADSLVMVAEAPARPPEQAAPNLKFPMRRRPPRNELAPPPF